MVIGIHHIGYAVKNMNKSIEAFRGLGYDIVGKMFFEKAFNVNIQMMKMGETYIELIEPFNSDAAVNNILSKNGNTPYHICYEVKDIKKAVTEFRMQEYIPVGDVVSAVTFGNSKVQFLYNKNIGLIELVESVQKV